MAVLESTPVDSAKQNGGSRGDGATDYRQLFAGRDFGDLPGPVVALKERSLSEFERTGFPTRRDEEWRFTNVAPIRRQAYRLAEPGGVVESLSSYTYPECSNQVFVDGFFRADLSDEVSSQGIRVESMKDALRQADPVVLGHLGRHSAPEAGPFVALNTALFEDGALVIVEPRAQIAETIHFIFVSTQSGELPSVSAPRNLIVVGESAQLRVLESYVGTGQYLTVPVTEIVGHANSVIDHYKLQKESLDGSHIASQSCWLGRDANFSSHSIQHGGSLVRTDVCAALDGTGVSCTLNGIYVLANGQHVDNHMRVEHRKPNCYSHNVYKGILDERSRAVFSGRIVVSDGAQKTDAIQTNRNLLLSKEAIVNSNPQLEIFADDVRCTHASTTGHLDEEALFYLRSRGIPEAAATSLLTYAFASEIVEFVQAEFLRAELNEFLFSRLAGGEIVRQAV